MRLRVGRGMNDRTFCACLCVLVLPDIFFESVKTDELDTRIIRDYDAMKEIGEGTTLCVKLLCVAERRWIIASKPYSDRYSVPLRFVIAFYVSTHC